MRISDWSSDVCSSDLVPVTDTGTIAESLANAADLARHAEALGYGRYWVAEHHGMAGIASAATAVVLAHVGHATSTIRIGAGGIKIGRESCRERVCQYV